ncbi:MAG: phosphate:Na+ symporter [Epulopiscium sp.]|jgi:phosphate:Na+ symporter|nr:Na/Pi cotransporter family protein [Defluviitaleaceae bacterium]MDK2789059.1 phosphate:Na+ symporter [Candidatus Epulonipiscium sp.]HHW66137.1 Na/Pi cotransporter family protein [Candidatus Epulonipiscium sp.]
MEDYTKIIFALIGGLGLFIYGMQIMAEGLQKSAGNKMKKLLEILTNNRFMGVLVGAGVTAIIQSSSATTVMVVGFVNAGLMNLTQAAGVIMGANIGTTVTGWIVSSAEWAKLLNPSELAPLAIAIGVVMMLFAKKKAIKQIGEIIAGFGILFVGLDMMGDAVKPLRNSPVFAEVFLTLGHNPLLGVFAGFAVTAIIQSSSASVGILQTLAAASLVPWSAAVYIIMGQNIGTCVTAMLSSIGATKNAKRAAYIHLLFNVMGTIIFSIIAVVYFYFINPHFGLELIGMTEISIVHTIFNIANTIILFPFAGMLVYLSGIFVRGKDEEDESGLRHLDERILETPTFAVENAIKEVVRMGHMAAENTKLAIEALLEKDEKKVEKVFKREKNINVLNRTITPYLVKISNSPINEQQSSLVTGLFHTVGDIERVGDHAENIAELAQFAIEEKVQLSDSAILELRTMAEKCIECFEDAIRAREENDPILAKSVEPNEDMVDKMEKELRKRHIERLAKNECSATSGVVFLDVISNLERISDHASNIALSVLDGHK